MTCDEPEHPDASPTVPRAVISIPPLCSVAQLTELVKPVCTSILVEGLRSGVHVPPYEGVDDGGHPCRPVEEEGGGEEHQPTIVAGQPLQPSSAPKITKWDGQLPLHLW